MCCLENHDDGRWCINERAPIKRARKDAITITTINVHTVFKLHGPWVRYQSVPVDVFRFYLETIRIGDFAPSGVGDPEKVQKGHINNTRYGARGHCDFQCKL